MSMSSHRYTSQEFDGLIIVWCILLMALIVAIVLINNWIATICVPIGWLAVLVFGGDFYIRHLGTEDSDRVSG